jgi:hypothetical protein
VKNKLRLTKLPFKFPSWSTTAGPGLRAADSSGQAGVNKTIYWPADLLPSVVRRAKIWTYGYNADAIGKLFQANNKNSILQHGNDFMVKGGAGSQR